MSLTTFPHFYFGVIYLFRNLKMFPSNTLCSTNSKKKGEQKVQYLEKPELSLYRKDKKPQENMTLDLPNSRFEKKGPKLDLKLQAKLQ